MYMYIYGHVRPAANYQICIHDLYIFNTGNDKAVRATQSIIDFSLIGFPALYIHGQAGHKLNYLNQ